MSIEERFSRFEKFLKSDLPAQKSLQIEKIAAELCASIAKTPTGNFLVKETSYGPGDFHGFFSFSNLDLGKKFRFDNYSCPPAKGDFSLEDVVVLDTETTGLSGGVGTVAFLVGLGFFQEGRYIVRQHFLPDLSEENGFLQHLFDELPGDLIISFNGRAFDLPLLTNRFLIQRLGSEFFKRKHLDVLFTLRRLFRLRLPDCALKTAERNLLSFERLGDIPSELIPQTYFKYLQTGQTDEIYQVLVHNIWDIISTLGVLVELSRYMEQAELSERLTDTESWALGRFYLKKGDLHKALSSFSRGERGQGDYQYKNLYQAALISKRLCDYETAMNYWSLLSECYNPHYFDSLEEMAKYYEHKLRNYSGAMGFCRRASETLYQISQLNPELNQESIGEKFQRRLVRLQTKLAKSK